VDTLYHISRRAAAAEKLRLLFQAEHIFAAFVFTFMTGNYIYDEDPGFDLDMASFGVVKVVSDRLKGFEQKMPWAPKLSFYRLGNLYESLAKK
jgi:hypothetical protein